MERVKQENGRPATLVDMLNGFCSCLGPVHGLWCHAIPKGNAADLYGEYIETIGKRGVRHSIPVGTVTFQDVVRATETEGGYGIVTLISRLAYSAKREWLTKQPIEDIRPA